MGGIQWWRDVPLSIRILVVLVCVGIATSAGQMVSSPDPMTIGASVAAVVAAFFLLRRSRVVWIGYLLVSALLAVIFIALLATGTPVEGTEDVDAAVTAWIYMVGAALQVALLLWPSSVRWVWRRGDSAGTRAATTAGWVPGTGQAPHPGAGQPWQPAPPPAWQPGAGPGWSGGPHPATYGAGEPTVLPTGPYTAAAPRASSKSRRTGGAVVLALVAIAIGVGTAVLVSQAQDGPDRSTDIAAIDAVATESLAAPDPTRSCDRLTPEFTQTVYGTLEQCKARQESDPTLRANLTDHQIDGDNATAIVTQVGGAAGRWTFVRDGSTWRVADWSTEFMRSALTVIYGRDVYRAAYSSDPFGDPLVRRCFHDRVQAQEEPALRTFVFNLVRNDSTGPVFDGFAAECQTQVAESRITPTRREFEQVVRRELATTLTPDQLECVLRELRGTVTDDEILRSGDDATASAQLEERARQGARLCQTTS